MTIKSSKKLIFTRHGQGEHNVEDNYDIRDAPLTDLGREQCQQLNEQTGNSIQEQAELVVVSPLRRTMETMLLSYPHLARRLDKQGKPPILLDIVQEANNIPCDTPLYPLESLKHSQDGIFAHLDFSGLSPQYASKRGIFHSKNLDKRAREVRQWLRQREEETIVVVAHGDILRWIVDGPTHGGDSQREWINCEVKVFTFQSDNDDDAVLIDVEGDHGIKPNEHTN